jgi:NSS family neurotransmitter:Na+ symporter
MAGSIPQNTDEHWSSRATFILAAVGSAVGLGNLWRFPYVAGESGGGAFVLAYILCVVLIGLPVLLAELMIGRRGGGSAIAAIGRLAKTEGKSGIWKLVPWMGMIASFLIVSFYCMIAGWVLYFIVLMVGDLSGAIGQNGLGALTAGAFAGVDQAEVSGRLGRLLQQPGTMMFYNAIFLAMTVFIVARGVSGGIEKAVTILMPSFFVMLIILVVVSFVQGDAGAAIGYLFNPDFSKLGEGLANGSLLGDALGQAFFSIGLGSALMITYGLYMNKDTNIPGAANIVVGADTLVAVIAGMAIFPIVFQFGLEPTAGPGLMFGTLPLAFQQMPFGSVFGIVFFAMAFFAALTSSISLLEPSVAFVDGDIDTAPEDRKRRRVIGAIILGLICFGLGCAHILSQVPFDPNIGHQPPISQENFFNTWVVVNASIFEGQTFFGFIDALTAKIMLPLGGLLTAVFAGWVVSKSASREELGFKTERGFNTWLVLVRFVCPAAVAVVMIAGLLL